MLKHIKKLSFNRYAGIELGGAKSQRTTVVFLDFFPEHNEILLSRIFAKIQDQENEAADPALIRLINHYQIQSIAMHAPLSLPPCIACKLKCPSFEKCKVPEVRWMRKQAAKHGLTGFKQPTPYTQRAVDIYLRTQILPTLAIPIHTEETLGSSFAPLTARTLYLKRHLRAKHFLEVNPKIALARMLHWYGISNRELRRYRTVEDGVENRFFILKKLLQKNIKLPKLEIRKIDLYKIAAELVVFDAFICALLGIYQEKLLMEKMPAGFLKQWGSVAIPKENLE